MRALLCMGALGIMLWGCQQPKPRIAYPHTAIRPDQAVQFGDTVRDPYRWLEDDASREVQAWVAQQNEVTNGYLEQIPYRGKIRARLTELMNYPRYGWPIRLGNMYLYSKNDGLQNQSVWYVQQGVQGKPEVLIDPNTLSSDSTTSLYPVAYSRNRTLVVMRVGEAGSDWGQLVVMDLNTRATMPDTLRWVRYPSVVWHNNGFYYTRYPALSDSVNSQRNENMRVYYHRMGTKQEQDELMYSDEANPLRYYYIMGTDDRRYLVLSAGSGGENNDVYVLDLNQGGRRFRPVVVGNQHKYEVVCSNSNGSLIVLTNDSAPNYRVVAIDPARPDRSNWVVLVPEQQRLLQRVTTAGGKLFLTYLQDISAQVYQHDMNGKRERQIELPDIGDVKGFWGWPDDQEVFYTFTSFIYPPTLFHYNIATGRSHLFSKHEAKYNPNDYETKLLYCKSKDSTRVPVFVVHKKGMQPRGDSPTLLYGFGGFGVPVLPNFNAMRLLLLEQGGVFASACVRGGGEFGESWHKAGAGVHKQNSVDDFIAAAEFLSQAGYTNPRRLAIYGNMSGGTLVAAAVNQRPDLCRVAVNMNGILDVMRYHRFTTGYNWLAEFGSPDKRPEFAAIRRYSPYHNVKPGQRYPAILVTTAANDNRVVPLHAYKYLANLQQANASENPTLLRVDMRGGSMTGNLKRTMELNTDLYSFMFFNMDFDYKPISVR